MHPNTCKNLLLNLRLTASSSTSSTRGGTAQPGTNVDRRTRSFCDFGMEDVEAEVVASAREDDVDAALEEVEAIPEEDGSDG